jgi:hypothetical protein
VDAYERPEHYSFREWVREYRIPLILVGVLILAVVLFMLLPGSRAMPV